MSNRQWLPYAFSLHGNYCWNYPFYKWCFSPFLSGLKLPIWVNWTEQFPAQQNWTDDWNQNHCRLTKCPPNVSCAPSFPIYILTWQQQIYILHFEVWVLALPQKYGNTNYKKIQNTNTNLHKTQKQIYENTSTKWKKTNIQRYKKKLTRPGILGRALSSSLHTTAAHLRGRWSEK